MSIPIVFFHYGNPDYLKYTLKQTRYFNPGSPIYLLGDEKNNRYSFITHVSASKYDAETTAFTKLYKHLSPNDEQYELNCFLRWFYVRAFCRENGIEDFIYLDSDVLAFQDLSDIIPLFKPCKIANTGADIAVPAFTYFNDYNTISNFCDYLIYSYSDKTALARIEEIYKSTEHVEITGGISDMTLFHLYDVAHPGQTIKIELINSNIAVDVSVNLSDGYEMENGTKKIYWQKGLPYAKNLENGNLIRFVNLHYQGHAKNMIIKHYKGGGYIIEKIGDPLRARIKKIKKLIRKR